MTVDIQKLKLMAEHATGFTDMSLAPDVVLELIAESERLREAHEQVCTNYNQVSYASEERGRQLAELKAECEGLRKDAGRYRWLNSQRSKVWKEIAELPMNHTAEFIDEAMSKKASNTCGSGEGSKTYESPAQQGSDRRSEQP